MNTSAARSEQRALRDLLEEVLSGYPEVEGNLLLILHELQERLGYLPEEALVLLAGRSGFSLQRLYSIATFYNHFSLEPRGRHLVQVCMGTACHVRGAPRVLSELAGQLGLEGAGETSADNEFTLSAVRCVGACSLAPVVTVDGETHAGVQPRKVRSLLRRYRGKGASPAAAVPGLLQDGPGCGCGHQGDHDHGGGECCGGANHHLRAGGRR